MISDLFHRLSKAVSYDADRDFYAKHFPSVAKEYNKPRFRPMESSDVNTIVEIETLLYNFPWSQKTVRDCLSIGYYECLVCVAGEEIISYGIVSSDGEASNIMNVCVAPQHQRQGHGRRMMDQLIQIAHQKRSKTMLLEVRPSNESAVEMYLTMGFNEIDRRKNYYPAKEGREDALIFALELVEDLSELAVSRFEADQQAADQSEQLDGPE